ncbi:MAG TPA: carboxypeptidase-like regulatory domain-containing protein, partial [Myxococcaceae bacterium]|nr:carboxypeptidase-like regulatory domain-containing protein [Myxococcaceae bacterium]
MHHRLRFVVAFSALLVALVALDRGALAQGVTGSALTGTVSAEGGGPIEGAALQLRNQSNGLTFTATSDANGQYFFD